MPVAHKINQHDPALRPSALSDEQFDELVALLKPVHDLAVKLLASHTPEIAPEELAQQGQEQD